MLEGGGLRHPSIFLQVTPMKVLGWLIAIIFIVGLLVVTGVLKLIF